METQLKLQLDVRNNAQDLQNYMLDLNNWEEEMKRKEKALINEKPPQTSVPPPRNKIKRSKLENEKKRLNKPKRISGYDYSAWDKFDVEKACAEIDEEDNDSEKDEGGIEEEVCKVVEGEENDESDFKDNKKNSLIDEAFYEKEMGNQYVKKEEWAEAIKCYTNAINLDSSNAIFYANRSLCFLKLRNFKAAETDATTAIQLDKNYVKAYQRRAFARQALGQLVEAKSDLEEILKHEPKNALARFELSKIEEFLKKEQKIIKQSETKTFNPKNMFKQESKKSEEKQTLNSSKKQPANINVTESCKKENLPLKSLSGISKSNVESVIKCGSAVTNVNRSSNIEKKYIERGDGDKVVPSETFKSHSEVFKPLPKWCKIIHPIDIPPHKRSVKPFRRIPIKIIDSEEDLSPPVEAKTECSNHCERKEKKELEKANLDMDESLSLNKISIDIPKTAIQFSKSWKILKNNPELAYSYLKKIPGNKLAQIFENYLESDFFSELVSFLASDEIEKEPEVVYNFLLGLTKVKRFSSMIMFMSEADRKCVKKSITELKKTISEGEISELVTLYELKI